MPRTFKDSNLKSSLMNLRIEWIHIQRTEIGGNMHIKKVTYNAKEHNKEYLINMTTKNATRNCVKKPEKIQDFNGA